MNEDRYQQLLGRLLDDELAVNEAKEFADWLREAPPAGADVRRHLFLWELYAQQHHPERAADAFANACQTRLLAEAGKQPFVEGVQARLRSGRWNVANDESLRSGTRGGEARLPHVASETWTPSSREPSSITDNVRRLLITLRWVVAGAVTAGIVGLWLWFFPEVNHQPTLSVAVSSAATLERGGQTSAAQDGLRIVPGDVLNVSGTNTIALRYGREPTQVIVDAGTQLRILPWARGKRFELRTGKIEATVARQRPGRPMIVATAQAEARVVGTSFTLKASTTETRLEVNEGKVKLTRGRDGSAVLVSAGNGAVAAANYELAALPLTGGLFREYWTNLLGEHWPDLITHTNYPDRPDASGFLTNLTSLEMPPNGGIDYGERLRGYVHPPKTGEYTFWITAQAAASLWLSPDENFENRVQMAGSYGVSPRDWRNAAVQHSAAVELIAGKRYWIEVLHKVGGDEGHLAVAWQGPGREREIIPLQFLSPFKPRGREKNP